MRKAFTLIEVLVIVCILGIIAALTLPFFFPPHIPQSGVIVGKHYAAGYTMYMPQCAGKSTILVPIYVPEKYTVDVCDDADGKNYNVPICPMDYPTFKIGGDYGNRKPEKE